MPPNECIEIALWDRFHWGPDDTAKLTQTRMRQMFVVLEQQRASKDAIENLGPPDPARMAARMKAMASMEAVSGAKGKTGSGP